MCGKHWPSCVLGFTFPLWFRHRRFFFFGIVVWRRRAPNRHVFPIWSPFVVKNASRNKIGKKQQVSPHCTTTHIHARDSTASFFRIPNVHKQFECEMIRSAEELFAIEKVAPQGMSIKKITETVFPVAQRWQTASCRSKTQRKKTSSTRI